MKLVDASPRMAQIRTFSALGRAVWDETFLAGAFIDAVEPFSALGRAVWDETWIASVGSVEFVAFSALGRAVWDETASLRHHRS